ncbi:MAG: SIMPL domain-containing protein [Terricaulis sp.]
MRIAFAAIFVALACESAAAETPNFDRPYWLDRPVIESIGRAQVDTAADRATFSVTFEETAHDAHAAQISAADRARRAAAEMRRVLPQGLEISSEIAVDALQAEYRDQNGIVQQRAGAQNVTGYVARVTLSVRVLDTRHAADVRAAAFALGPEDSTDLQYTLDQTVDAQRRVYAAAVEDAAARAHVAAVAAGTHLGPLLVLQEGQGPCMGHWNHDPGVVVTGTRAVRQDFEAVSPVTTVSREDARPIVEDIARLQLPDDQTPVRMQAVVCAVYATTP